MANAPTSSRLSIIVHYCSFTYLATFRKRVLYLKGGALGGFRFWLRQLDGLDEPMPGQGVPMQGDGMYIAWGYMAYILHTQTWHGHCIYIDHANCPRIYH